MWPKVLSPDSFLMECAHRLCQETLARSVVIDFYLTQKTLKSNQTCWEIGQEEGICPLSLVP